MSGGPSGPSSPPPAAGGRVGSAVGRAVAALALASTRRPLVTVVISLLLAAAGMLYTLHALTFVTSNLRLLPQKASYVVRLQDYQRDFGELNDIVVVVEAASPERSKAYAARLVAELEQQGFARSRITYRVDPAYFEGRGLLYLSPDELITLRDRLFDYQEFIESYAARPTLPQLLAGLNQQIANSMALGFFDVGLRSSGGATDLRFLESVIDQISARLDGQATYTSPWSTAFSVGRFDDPDAGYFFSADRKWLFLFVQQRREEGNFTDSRSTIEAIRRTMVALRPDFPGVEAGVTGGPAISNDEMSSAFSDSEVASILASVLTMALLIAAFRSLVSPVLLMGTLTVSLAWSMGIITLVIGHLSIFSVMFVSIVVGIGVDYGVYWFYRYQEELALEPTAAAAVRRTGEEGGPALLMGALNSMGAFFVLVLTDFQGIREFGFVSAISILLAFVSMITLYPAMLAMLPRRWSPVPTPGQPAIARATWLEGVIEYRKTILAITAVLIVVAIWGAVHVGFDYNMLKLQAKGVESVAWEERILTRAGRSGVTALATASGLEELRRKRDAFTALPSVSQVESVLMLVPDSQPEKLKLIEQFAPIVAPVRVARAPALIPAELRAPLQTLRRRLRLATEEGGEQARREVQPVLAKIEGLLAKLSRVNLRGARPALEELQGQVAGDFADKLTTFQKSLPPRTVVPGDVPPELRHRYVGSSGRYLLRIQPAVDIWQREGAERFVTDLRRVDPDVTGPPITSYEAIRFIQHGYFQGTLYALLLVVLLTLALLRSVRGTALALVPLVLGVLWTLGFMRVFGLQFNLANVWALPLIIGTAAEFGVNVFIRYQEGLDKGGPTLVQSTVLAVLLNGLTTIAGFASLMVAQHQGIFGLGLLLTVGVTAALFASLVVLPVLLRLFYGPPASDAPPAREPVSPERVTA